VRHAAPEARCTVRTGATTLTAAPGEVIYLRAGTPGSFDAEEDTELVYVTSPPYGAANREVKAELRRDLRGDR